MEMTEMMKAYELVLQLSTLENTSTVVKAMAIALTIAMTIAFAFYAAKSSNLAASKTADNALIVGSFLGLGITIFVGAKYGLLVGNAFGLVLWITLGITRRIIFGKDRPFTFFNK